MRRVLLAALTGLLGLTALSAVGAGSGAAGGGFSAWFTGRTLRADYVDGGTATDEWLGFSGWRVEGPWAGPRRTLIEDDPRGEYLAELRDPRGRVLYSVSFSGLFAEWQMTGPARRGERRAFAASVRVPEPRRPARLRILRRGPEDRFRVLLEQAYDPADRGVDRRPLERRGEVIPLRVTGPPAERFDLLIAGEGYTRDARAKLLADARRLSGAWLATEPMRSLADRIDVRVLFVPSDEPGITDPRRDRWRASPFGCRYDSFGSDRYVLTFDERRLRELVARAPYDALVLLVNERKYGGGGIYGLWATVSADTAPAAYVFIHELGHSIGGLADEYYTSSTSYEALPPVEREPPDPNVTALPGGRPRWADMVEPGTPIPTPWNKSAWDEMARRYESRRRRIIEAGGDDDAMEALFADQAREASELLAHERYRGRVGAFEGAAYRSEGLYRPALDCLMFRRGAGSFCPVCRKALAGSILRFF